MNAIMLGLFEVLEQIKAKPGLYLGCPSVSDLFMFLNGYEFARTQLDIKLTESEECFYEDMRNFNPGSSKNLV